MLRVFLEKWWDWLGTRIESSKKVQIDFRPILSREKNTIYLRNHRVTRISCFYVMQMCSVYERKQQWQTFFRRCLRNTDSGEHSTTLYALVWLENIFAPRNALEGSSAHGSLHAFPLEARKRTRGTRQTLATANAIPAPPTIHVRVRMTSGPWLGV